jgi:hypothetical protein
MRAALACALAFATGACATLPVDGDGVVALEVELPASLTLVEGGMVQVEARALDRNGDEVASPIQWSTPDTTVTVDALTGVVTGAAPSGTGRVQASVGTLRSDFITFTLQPAPAP